MSKGTGGGLTVLPVYVLDDDAPSAWAPELARQRALDAYRATVRRAA